jgi:predicted GNAT superfamily acetyltransferase
MTGIVVREACHDDFARIVALNAAEVRQTSAMDLARLGELAKLASVFRVAVVGGEVAAFILALREGAPYLNDNYAWFAARFTRFVYVDRIVVATAFAGLGIGSRLYEDLFAYARKEVAGVVTCEYNVEPPNPASQKFHARFGFREVGRQRVAAGSKLVSLQAAEV